MESRTYWPLVPLAFGAALSLFFFRLATDHEDWKAWKHLIALPMWPVFSDLWVTLGHLGEAAEGKELLADPDSEFAYPRAVLEFHRLGLQLVPAPWLGLIQALVAVIGIVVVLRPATPIGALLTTLLLFTPPFRLGLERGNLDFALFLICGLGAWLWSRTLSVWSVAWPITAFGAGVFLKLHPVFAVLGAAIAESGRRRLAWLVAAALIAGYWLLNLEELSSIAQKVPVATTGSWGCRVVFAGLERFLSKAPETFIWMENLAFPAIAVAGYVLAAAVACGIGLRLARRFASHSTNPAEWCCYWVGASICCGAFVGANYAYRWVFVILTIPLLLRLRLGTDPLVANWSRITLVAIAVSLAAPIKAGIGIFLLTQIANWACVLLLLVGCAALPRPTAFINNSAPSGPSKLTLKGEAGLSR